MTAAKPKTLAELRESPDVGLPEQTYALCMSGKLNAEMQRVSDAIEEAVAADDQPKRLGAKSQVMKLNDEREKLRVRMAEHEVTVRFRAKPAHVWRKWVSSHPVREDNDLDERLGYNVDALQDSVSDYIVDVNGAPLADGDWQFMLDNAAPGDLWRMAAIVRGLHESGVAIPKSWTGLLKSRESDDEQK